MAASRIVRIGTHNGTFHCDEVLACFMLKQLGEYKEAVIVRTRDEETLNSCDIVVDVGGIFDPEKKRFDHHQRSFNETMNSLNSAYKWTTRLSSAGLVYYHFGHRVISEIIGMPRDSKSVLRIYPKIYENFVEEVDAIDNGIEHCTNEPRYAISTHLSARVGRLNPPWNEKCTDEDALFQKAMTLVGSEFIDRLQWYAKSWIPAREIVFEAMKKRAEIDHSEEIIVMESGGCPWKDHIYELEKEMTVEKNTKFIIFPDQSGSWRVQCVGVRLGSFTSRLPLPEAWCGLRDEALAKACNFEDAIFVHATGFIGGAKTRESAVGMAKATILQAERILKRKSSEEPDS